MLASKVYYYLGEYDEALSFALGAGSAFDAEIRVSGSEEYVETVVCKYFKMKVTFYSHFPSAKAIDRYIEARSLRKEDVDMRLQNIIEGIFKRCIDDGEHKQVRTSAAPQRTLSLKRDFLGTRHCAGVATTRCYQAYIHINPGCGTYLLCHGSRTRYWF